MHVTVHLHLAPDMADDAFAVDQEGGALDAHVALAVHALFHPHAKRLGGLVLRVGQQRVGQGELRLELGLLGRRIGLGYLEMTGYAARLRL